MRVVDFFEKMTPPTIPQLAVPVSVPKRACTNGITFSNPILKKSVV